MIALVETVPHQMAIPVEERPLTEEEQIEVSWSELTGVLTGGPSILSYNLQWDRGLNSGDWYDIVGFEIYQLDLSIVVS